MFLLSLVCIFGSFGGVLLAMALKGLLVAKFGLEPAQKKMFIIGIAAILVAVILGVLTGTCRVS